MSSFTQWLRGAACGGAHRHRGACGVTLVLLLAVGGLRVQRGQRPGTAQAADTILIDSVHAHNYLNGGLEPGNHDYHSLFGLGDAFDHLKTNGFAVSEITSGPVSHSALQGVSILFINLVSDNLPPFLVEEIAAIKEFVTRGGRLLVITDHSNCYHHTHKLTPLFTELGLQLYNESALESPPHAAGPGPGWIIVDHFRKHPITRGLSAISFHTGGTVDSRGAVATLSDSGWGDLWETAPYGENQLRAGNRGNYGNMRKDENERQGRLAVVTARTLGNGRIVVVGDQNVFGNLWIRYADNARLFLNVIAWLSGRNDVGTPTDLDRPDTPTVLLLENYANVTSADYGDHGFYHAYAVLSRHVSTFVRDRVDGEFDLVVVPAVERELDPAVVPQLRARLQTGGNVLVLARGAQPGPLARRKVARIMEGIGTATVNETPGKTEYATPRGGTLVVLHHAERFDNARINAPTTPPNDEERTRSDELLSVVHGALTLRRMD